MPSLIAQPLPTGGIITLNIDADTTMTLERAVQSASPVWQTLYSGDPLSLWIDTGDLMNAPLDAQTTYLYRVTDANGQVESGPILPAAALTINQDKILSLLLRMMQAAFTNMVLPRGFVRPQVLHAMPLTFGGSPALPIITINLDYGPVMEEAPIGQGVNASQTNEWTLTAQVRRRFSMTVLSYSAQEREYYRDAIISVFSSMAPLVFGQIWDDTRFMYQAYSSQKTKDEESPAFYFAQVMLDLVGSLNTTVTTQFGSVENVEVDFVSVQDTTDYP